jgi:PIN domain nuclease of toxin-antitoxin system
LILLDTQVVIWIAMHPAGISKARKYRFGPTRNDHTGIAISDMTLLELARLSRARRVHRNTSREAFLWEVERRFVILPGNGRICVQAFDLPAAYPKHPADRIIGATALVKGLTLLPADRAIRSSHALPTVG